MVDISVLENELKKEKKTADTHKDNETVEQQLQELNSEKSNLNNVGTDPTTTTIQNSSSTAKEDILDNSRNNLQNQTSSTHKSMTSDLKPQDSLEKTQVHPSSIKDSTNLNPNSSNTDIGNNRGFVNTSSNDLNPSFDQSIQSHTKYSSSGNEGFSNTPPTLLSSPSKEVLEQNKIMMAKTSSIAKQSSVNAETLTNQANLLEKQSQKLASTGQLSSTEASNAQSIVGDLRSLADTQKNFSNTSKALNGVIGESSSAMALFPNAYDSSTTLGKTMLTLDTIQKLNDLTNLKSSLDETNTALGSAIDSGSGIPIIGPVLGSMKKVLGTTLQPLKSVFGGFESISKSVQEGFQYAANGVQKGMYHVVTAGGPVNPLYWGHKAVTAIHNNVISPSAEYIKKKFNEFGEWWQDYWDGVEVAQKKRVEAYKNTQKKIVLLENHKQNIDNAIKNTEELHEKGAINDDQYKEWMQKLKPEQEKVDKRLKDLKERRNNLAYKINRDMSELNKNLSTSPLGKAIKDCEYDKQKLNKKGYLISDDDKPKEGYLSPDAAKYIATMNDEEEKKKQQELLKQKEAQEIRDYILGTKKPQKNYDQSKEKLKKLGEDLDKMEEEVNYDLPNNPEDLKKIYPKTKEFKDKSEEAFEKLKDTEKKTRETLESLNKILRK